MQNLTCIVCPIGCALEISTSSPPDNYSVTGNKCPRGVDYALEEIKAPKRVVTATAPIIANETKNDLLNIHRVPVKTNIPVLREKIPALLEDIYKTEVKLPVKTGDVIIAGWQNTDINVVAVRTIGL